MIVTITFFHIFEAVVLLVTRAADTSIGIDALLDTFGYPWVASMVLIFAAFCAIIGQWETYLKPFLRLVLLTPQQAILWITAGGVVVAVLRETDPDGVMHPWSYLMCNYGPRVILPFIYTVAILNRIR